MTLPYLLNPFLRLNGIFLFHSTVDVTMTMPRIRVPDTALYNDKSYTTFDVNLHHTAYRHNIRCKSNVSYRNLAQFLVDRSSRCCLYIDL